MLKLSPESPLFILLIIISFLVVTLSAWLSPQAFILKPFGFNDITQLLLLPFFISLLLERALEVFITTWRGSIAEQLDMEVQQQNSLIAEKQKLIEQQRQQNSISSLDFSTISSLPPEGMSLEQQVIQQYTQDPDKLINIIQPQIDDLNTLINELNQKEKKRLAYKSDTRIIALWTSLLFGLLLSAIGIRLLEPLIIINFNNPVQVIVFRCLDSLLTGGVIAGGSEGIHKIVQVLIDFVEATSKQIKDKGSPY